MLRILLTQSSGHVEKTNDRDYEVEERCAEVGDFDRRRD